MSSADGGAPVPAQLSADSPVIGVLGIQAAGIDQATSTANMDKMLDSVRGLGGRSIRLDVAWQGVEWATNKWTFARFDHLVTAANARNIAVDFILDYNNPIYGGSWNEIPRNLTAWDRYVATVVKRYAGRVRSYEVWNEADHPDFNRDFKTPSLYLKLLQRTYPIIKSKDPSAIVAMTSLARAIGSNATFWDGIAAQAQPFFDVANIHVYSATVAERVAYARRLNPGKPIWATEVGRSANDEKAQASFLRSVIPELRAAGVEVIYIFCWRDNVTAVTPTRFGLLRSDFSLRPAAVAFRDLAQIRQHRRDRWT